ncbi:MAG: hypothetical protein LC685_04665, partial [Actinobacteria bacterium]|nr:hypothetical protein [Actinomycetota bacterium]
SLAREHYGLAGVLVSILAGMALSLSVDALVIASKGLDPLEFTNRLLIDAAFLGIRLAIVAAVVSGAVSLFMRLVRHSELTIDQTYTAVTFALTPLLAAPVLAAALAIAPETLPVVGILAIVLLARLLYGLVLNLLRLAPAALAVAAAAIVIASVPVTLSDQVSRIQFTALAYRPELAPQFDATPANGTRVSGEGYELTLPARWKQVFLGLPGELARFQTDNDVLVVMRATGSALVTPDSYAENVAIRWRRGLENSHATRSIFRNRDLVILDDTYTGTVGGRPELLRQFTTVVGTRGMALQFRYIEPDETSARAESASIAVTWKVAGR